MQTKNFTLAFIVAVIFWSVVFSPLVTITFKGNIATVIDVVLGFMISGIIFRSILKLERKV